MKKIYKIALLSSISALFVACTANFEEINYDHYGPGAGDVLADDYALGSAMNNLAGCVVSPDVNTTQFTDCLLGGTAGGYFADAQNAWSNTISNYNPTDDWTRVFLKSDKVIPVLFTNYNAIKSISEQTGNPVPLAIAKIIKVAAMHRITDTYGAIPYSKIGEDGAITTPYDSQEEIYNKFFEELNGAIADLTENENQALVASADYVYSGNLKNWIKFANSLKLRLAMRIVYANPTKAQAMAEEAASHPGGLITKNDENAAWNYFGSSSNPMYTAVKYNTPEHEDGKVCPSGGDSHAAADIICYMNGYEDPRRAKFFTESEWPDNKFVGLRRGIVIPSLKTIGHKYSGINILPNAPLMWMNAAEVSFLCAEAVGVFNFNMGGKSAETFYNEGIRLSFQQWGVEGAEKYIKNNNLHPNSYVDPNQGVNSYSESLSNITIQWEESASPDAKQERIMIQKWIANWTVGHEAWSDHRRTGFPKFIPATAEGNKSGGIVDDEGARRMPYPRDEYVNNAANINDAVSKYLNGVDNMGQRVWWDCKKAN